MLKKILKIFVVLAGTTMLVLGVALFFQLVPVMATSGESRGGGSRGGGTPGSGNLNTPLSDTEVDTIRQAIMEEYGALNLYQGVIDKFGEVSPFVEIAASEQKHVDALVRLATKYGVTVPDNPGLTENVGFATLVEACQAGVNAEIADAALYDQFEPIVTHTDLLQVFSNLQRASLENHLPAFRDCP